MFKHLIIATDGSEFAGKAVTQGSALAAGLGARITIVMATEPWRVASGEFASIVPLDDYDAACAATATRILKSAEAAAQAAGLPLDRIDTLHIRDRFPAEGIIETAERLAADLIVMASHGRRGLSRLLLGSQTNRVVTHSTLPVLVCR